MCNINYHMVWSVKYRRKILNSGLEEYLKELVQQIAEDKGFTVLKATMSTALYQLHQNFL